MGADFLYATVPCFTLTPERESQFIDMFSQHIADDLDIGWLDEHLWDFDEGPEHEAEILSHALTALRRVDDCRESGNREVSYLSLSGMDYEAMITGGMSWGDSPTDAFEFFRFLEDAPDIVYQQLIAWAREDKNNPPDIAETSDAMDAESREPVLRGGQLPREEE